MPNQVPVSSVQLVFEDDKLGLLVDGQPFNLRLLQKVEIVIDAAHSRPFVRLTAAHGDTRVKLGETMLEVKPGEPGKHTFGDGPPPGPAYHGHGVQGYDLGDDDGGGPAPA